MSYTNVSNPVKIAANWKTSAKKLQSKFPTLTDADLEFSEGKENDLLKRIEVRLDKKRNEVVNILKEIQQ